MKEFGEDVDRLFREMARLNSALREEKFAVANSVEADEKTTDTTEKTTQIILEEIRKKSDITRIELAEVCGISPNGIKWHLKQMQEKGLIRRIGPDKGGNWEVIETKK